MQNIGAYGVELKDVFDSLTALDRQDGTLREFDRQACRSATATACSSRSRIAG